LLRSRQTVAAAALGGLTILLLMAFRTLEQTGDSLTYATAIKTGDLLFHPHHLLFSPLARLVFLTLTGVGLPVDGILAGQIHNAAWAAVAVVGLFFLTRRWTGSSLLAGAAALALLSCQGFLLFASQVEVYIPTLGCAALLLLSLEWHGTRPRRLALIIALFSLLILYHQSNVLFCLPLAAFFLLQEKQRGLRTAAGVIGAAGALVLAIYIGAYLVQGSNPSPSGFVQFCLRYALLEQWAAPGNLSSPGVLSAMTAQVEALALIPGAARQGAGYLMGILVLGVVAWNLAMPARQPASRPRRALLAIWLLAYHAFFIWWQPGQDEFFIITLLPLILLMVLMVNDLARLSARSWVRPALAGALLLAAGALTFRHVEGTLLPRHKSRGPAYLEAARLHAMAPPGCIMVTQRQVVYSLRYDFDVRPEQSHNLLRAQRIFLYERQMDAPVLPSRACVVLPVAGLAPGRLAYEKPAQWLDFLRWILRVTPDPEGAGLTAAATELAEDSAGALYVLQPGSREPVANLHALCRRLDALYSQGPRPAFSGFTTWLEATTSRLRRAGVPLPQLRPEAGAAQSSSPPT